MRAQYLSFFILFTLSFSGIKAQNCNNLGFEDNAFTNWEAWTGTATGIIAPTVPVMYTQGFVASRHQITSGTGTDFWSNNTIPVVSPNGGNFSCQLGNPQPGGQAEQLRMKFLVTPDLTSYVYQYAVVFEDPGHIGRPLFEIKIYDQFDSIIPCGEYLVRADQGLTGFVSTSITLGTVHWIVYKNWTDVAVDLSSYLGDSVTVEFTTADCNAGQHFGYAYIDGYCQTLEIDAQSNCSNDYTLTAPSGYQSYIWSNGMSGQSINVIGAPAGDSITVSLVPYMGCPTEITYNYGTPSPVIANFSMGTGCIGDNINFTNLSTPDSLITNWEWNFGDGTTSNLTNPNHIYTSSGNFNVSLIVSSNAGCSDTLIQNITICGNGGAEFTTQDICEQNEASFTDLSINTPADSIVSWYWDFDDNHFSTLQNPTHFYLNEGIYTVQLVITYNSGITDSISHSISVNPNPIAGFVSDNVCNGSITSFFSTSTITSGQITQYSWDFDDGTTGSGDIITHQYLVSSVNMVNHTVISDRGCTSSIIQPNSVYTLPSVTIENSTPSGCAPLTTQINTLCQGVSDTVFVEAFDMTFETNSTYTSIPTLNGVQYILYVSGTYNVWGDTRILDAAYLDNNGIVSQNGLFANGILLGARPTPDVYDGSTHTYSYLFTGDGNTIDFTFNDPNFSDNYGLLHYSIYRITNPCENYSYNWSFGNGSQSVQDSNLVNYPVAGNYTIALDITNTLTNCTYSISDSVEVFEIPQANFSVTNVCENNIIQPANNSSIQNGTITLTIWDFGDGTILNGNNPSHLYFNAGTYTISLITISNNGCSDTLSANVTINPNPVVSFTGTPLSGCPPLNSVFSNQSSISSGNIIDWYWDFGDGNNSTLENSNNLYENTGFYDVSLTVISDSGCSASENYSNYIEVYSPPEAAFSFSPNNPDVYHPIVNFTDESIDAYAWNWNFNNLGSSNLQNPQYSFENEGNYTVSLTITNQNGCTDSTSQIVIVSPVYSLYIPNAFTPDGNGTNETFYAVGENIIEFELLIFNRWGELLFQSEDINYGWDGTFKGEKVKQDVYVYKAKFKDINNGRHEKFGHINLLR